MGLRGYKAVVDSLKYAASLAEEQITPIGG